ncbi:hypothetical protein NGTWS0302_16920 [Mycolicibacterium cyprinidarum]|uniref:TetR family transcriptional regulator n=1 Tax=Mycolicibacterium cyprinidarum TaxID=2860311 RepID=A0ABQ4VD12_9MYCO|nr:hypothetical protein NGTWS1702_24630 [Mycolicibacterium sp. NGTWSNA01]GJF18561.1 hypothetical protein NGTWS0302_16920 [Mycolicibacterium sp. NGTWS0302]
MTIHEAADQRRATALVCHYGRNNLDGINAILAEASEADRVVPLIGATLSLHAHIVPILYTEDGLACLTHMIYALAEDPEVDEDCARAARLAVAHSEQDATATNAVLAAAAHADRATQLITAILTLFSSTVPTLYSELGLKVLERSILNWAAREDSE